MDGIPLTRASQIIQMAKSLEDHGLSAKRVATVASVPMWYTADPDELIPTRHIWRFMRYAARAAGNPAFGHVVGENDPVGGIGPLAARILQCPNLFRGVRVFCRDLPLHTSNMRGALIVNDGLAWLVGTMRADVIDAGLAEMEQCILMQLVRIVRLFAGSSWRPRQVRLQADVIAGLERAEALSDAHIHYLQRVTAIGIPRSVLLLPPIDRRSLSRATRTRYEVTAPAPVLCGSVRQLVETMLHEGYPTIETAGEMAGLPVRTLQRYLHREGVTYSELVERARFDAACRLLNESDAKVMEIALDLGYSDQANFTHAFLRWAGVSPRQYRRLRMAT